MPGSTRTGASACAVPVNHTAPTGPVARTRAPPARWPPQRVGAHGQVDETVVARATRRTRACAPGSATSPGGSSGRSSSHSAPPSARRS